MRAQEVKIRLPWLLGISFAAVFWIIAGWWLSQNAECQRWQVVVVLFTGIGGGVIASLVWLFIFPDNGSKEKATTLLLVAIIGIGGTTIFTPWSLRAWPDLRTLYCPLPSCPRVQQIQELLVKEENTAAQKIAEDCIQETEETNNACAQQCGCGLTKALIGITRVKTNEERFIDAEQALSKAVPLNKQYICGQEVTLEILRDLLTEKTVPLPPTQTPTSFLTDTPTPTPRPFTLEIIRKVVIDGLLMVDVKVELVGLPAENLNTQEFSLFIDGEPIPIKNSWETREADPVCIMAAVDNSGSIKPGLEKIRSAIIDLDKNRLPSDEIGLVTFAVYDQITIVEPIRGKNLDTGMIDGSGGYTAFLDGVYQAILATDLCASQNKFVLLISDGNENNSVLVKNLSNLVNEALTRNVKVCSIAIPSDDPEYENLSNLSTVTGCGDYYDASSNYDLVASLLKEIVGKIRSFYRLEVDVTSLASGNHVGLLLVDASEVKFEFQR